MNFADELMGHPGKRQLVSIEKIHGLV
jgi:hypothetical protein